MLKQVGSVTRKKSSDFHGGIWFQLSFTSRWELEDKNFLQIDIICLDDSLKYQIIAIKTNENSVPLSNSMIFRKPQGTDLVTASELIPGFCQSKSNVQTPGSLRMIKSPTGGIVSGIKSPPLARTLSPHLAGFTLKGAWCSVFMLGIFLGEGVGNPREPLSICTTTSTNPYHPRSIFLQKSYHCPSPQG